jgi:hypothetical protein
MGKTVSIETNAAVDARQKQLQREATVQNKWPSTYFYGAAAGGSQSPFSRCCCRTRRRKEGNESKKGIYSLIFQQGCQMNK